MAKTKESPVKEKVTEPITHESLELEAYFHWLERGCPMGDDLTDWVEVEKKYTESAKHN